MCNEDIGQAAVHCLHGIAHEVLALPVGQQQAVCLLCAAAEAQQDDMNCTDPLNMSSNGVHPAVQVITVDAERTNLLMFHSDLTAGNMELDKGKSQKCMLLILRRASSREHPAVSPRHCPAAEVAQSMRAAYCATAPPAQSHSACFGLFEDRVMC